MIPAEQSRFLVEWYWPDLAREPVDASIARVLECARSLTSGGSAIQLLVTVAVPADEIVLAVFDAGSAQTVAEVCLLAGIPAHRLTPAVEAKVWAPIRRETPDSTNSVSR